VGLSLRIAFALTFLASVTARPAHSDATTPSWLPARPGRYVTDTTGRLDAARLAALNEKLAAFERQTSTQVLVYVAAKLPAGTTLEEFANQAFHAWGIGQKGRDNGVLFVVFLDDRAMRIEVGYGLEGALPDARTRQITGTSVKPLFKEGDYVGGVEAGADAILAAARGEAYVGRERGEPVTETTEAPWKPFAIIGIIPALIVYFVRRRQATWWKAALLAVGAGAKTTGGFLVLVGLVIESGASIRLGLLLLPLGAGPGVISQTIASWSKQKKRPELARLQRAWLGLRLMALFAAGFLGWPVRAAALWCVAVLGSGALLCLAAANGIEKARGARIRGILSPIAYATAVGVLPFLRAAVEAGAWPPGLVITLLAGAFVGVALRADSFRAPRSR
jgi:uncharacterized protein